MSFESSSTGNFSGKKLSDLEYPDDVVPVREDPNKLPAFLSRLRDAVGIFGIHFGPSKVNCYCRTRMVQRQTLLLEGKSWLRSIIQLLGYFYPSGVTKSAHCILAFKGLHWYSLI